METVQSNCMNQEVSGAFSHYIHTSLIFSMVFKWKNQLTPGFEIKTTLI
jgi:hypothetical protein